LQGFEDHPAQHNSLRKLEVGLLQLKRELERDLEQGIALGYASGSALSGKATDWQAKAFASAAAQARPCEEITSFGQVA
jgi:hypothetical protein